jgi:hypothetical protein
MQMIKYGRRKYNFANGMVELTGTSITEKASAGEDEQAFTRRLMKKYGNKQGTVEIVFKNSSPDYAIITFK